MDSGKTIRLEFTQFDVEWGRNCKNDFVRITDGDGTILMEKSCGNTLPADITSTSNIVKLVFSTDGSGTGWTGWSVSWSAVTPGECQQHVWIFLDNFSNSLLLKIMFDDALSKSDLHIGFAALS